MYRSKPETGRSAICLQTCLQLKRHLSSELLVCFCIQIGSQLLFQESEKDGNDDAGLEYLSKDDEEDWDCEEVGHCSRGLRQAGRDARF